MVSITIVPMILALALASSGAVLAQGDRQHHSPDEYFKNFALSSCIAEGYKSEEVVKDSTAAAGGYLELGSYPMEAHSKAALLAKQFLQKKYVSKSGKSLTLMKCIDFYHSQELDQLVRKYRGGR